MGTRTGGNVSILLLRRFPKACLNSFAPFLAGRRIADLGSGMRVFTRELAKYLWHLFPSFFSFTSTMTMGSLSSGFRVKEIPINDRYQGAVGSLSVALLSFGVEVFLIRLLGELVVLSRKLIRT